MRSIAKEFVEAEAGMREVDFRKVDSPTNNYLMDRYGRALDQVLDEVRRLGA